MESAKRCVARSSPHASPHDHRETGSAVSPCFGGICCYYCRQPWTSSPWCCVCAAYRANAVREAIAMRRLSKPGGGV